MRRLWESMNKKWLAGPYLVWMVGFIVIPLLLIVYYGLTDKSGAFTLANVLSISTPEHVKVSTCGASVLVLSNSLLA